MAHVRHRFHTFHFCISLWPPWIRKCKIFESNTYQNTKANLINYKHLKLFLSMFHFYLTAHLGNQWQDLNNFIWILAIWFQEQLFFDSPLRLALTIRFIYKYINQKTWIKFSSFYTFATALLCHTHTHIYIHAHSYKCILCVLLNSHF